MHWLALLKPGDWIVAILALACCTLSVPLIWQHTKAEKAVIKRGGEVFIELDLSQNRRVNVPGPLGTTVVAVENRQVRVVSDPGPRQYCVSQGWLKRAGEIAICAPNQVSVQIQGGKEAYDSLGY